MRVLRGWQRSVTRRRSGASPCAVGRVPLPAAEPAAAGGEGTSLGAASSDTAWAGADSISGRPH